MSTNGQENMTCVKRRNTCNKWQAWPLLTSNKAGKYLYRQAGKHDACVKCENTCHQWLSRNEKKPLPVDQGGRNLKT